MRPEITNDPCTRSGTNAVVIESTTNPHALSALRWTALGERLYVHGHTLASVRRKLEDIAREGHRVAP